MRVAYHARGGGFVKTASKQAYLLLQEILFTHDNGIEHSHKIIRNPVDLANDNYNVSKTLSALGVPMTLLTPFSKPAHFVCLFPIGGDYEPPEFISCSQFTLTSCVHACMPPCVFSS